MSPHHTIRTLFIQDTLAKNPFLLYYVRRRETMAEHIMHKKDTKKPAKKSLKEKREEKKAKKKTKES